MKELTHEDWMKNQTPRMMWVWTMMKLAGKNERCVCFNTRC